MPRHPCRSPERPQSAACRRWLLPVLLLSAWPTTGFAAAAQFSARQLQGEGWQATRVTVRLAVDARARPAISLHADSALLPAGLGAVRQLDIHCPRLREAKGRWSCAAAEVRGVFADWGRQAFTLAFDYDPRRAQLQLGIPGRGIAFAGGSLRLDARLDGNQWQASASLADARLDALESATRRWAAWPEGAWSGPVAADLEAQGEGTALRALQATVELPALRFSSVDELTAAEGLAGTLTLGWLDPRGPDEPVRPELALRYVARGGQWYLDPVFMDAGAAPFTLELRGEWQADDRTLQVGNWSYLQPGVVAARGSAVLDGGPGPWLKAVDGQFDEVGVARAWPLYVAPFLASTDLKDVEATGSMGGRFGVREGEIAYADLDLHPLTLEAPDDTFAWRGLSGHLRWSRDESESLGESADHATQLAWDSGNFYRLPFGPATARVQLAGRGLRLLAPLTLPVFDGGLHIETLRLRHAGEPRMWLRLDAEVLPIDMAKLSRAFGWPGFGGKLAGRIPKAALDDGLLTFGGNLEAEVFGGRISLGNLRLEDALGRFPQFRTDVSLRNLDLELLTRTFDFGHISGRLDGDVRGLELFDWQPVAFDARLATPADYRGPRRITPLAVRNLLNQGSGSGITSALSGIFLGLFDDFGYERLGIACRLERDVCTLDGVAPAPGGYYLLQGSGLPRVDVVGSQGRIGWRKLLRQLARISRGAPLVAE